MDHSQSSKPEARFLGAMFSDNAAAAGLWQPRELAALLRHQLDALLSVDLAPSAAGEKQRRAELARQASPPIETFGQLLCHATPPRELLELVAQFAKHATRRSEAPLPEEIATVLYGLSLAAGLVHGGWRLAELDEQALRQLLERIAELPWVDRTSNELLRAGLAMLDKASATARTVTPAEQSTPPLPPTGVFSGLGRLGEYTLLEKLGEGGMGTVYKARHTELERLAAIKVLRPGLADEEWAAARFRREIKLVGALDHPHIVRAYDARTIGSTLLLVMEYVDGRDLHDLVARCGPLGVADACELMRQAALGLQCAHEHGLVHRDIKPSNLILSRQGQVKILDLGLARLHADVRESRALTAVGQMMGTPDFMAPEQISDSHAVDVRADIYSLGCTLYMLLVGRPPFCGPQYATLLSKLDAHRDQPPPALRQVRPDVPDGLPAVLKRMLAKRPLDRYATPGDVAAALARFAEGADIGRLLRTADNPNASPSIVIPIARAAEGPSKPGRTVLWAVASTLVVLLAGAGVFWRSFGSRPAKPDGKVEPVTAATASGAGPLPGWIVMSWTRPRLGKPNLWLFRPDGKQRFNLTNDARYFDIHPKFSPDGRKIAFVRGTNPTETNSICVCNTDGSQLQTVVAPRDKEERFAGPIWGSNTRIFYARDPKPDLNPDMEIWQVDLVERKPRRAFCLQDAVGKGDGLVTDISPDGRRLALVVQMAGVAASADIYVADLQGHNLQLVWQDQLGEYKDGRALWSPDGAWIAWHHNFGRGLAAKPLYYGVGLARADAASHWTARLQSDATSFVTPLAWCPQGRRLLCAQLDGSEKLLPSAKLFLMDEQFQLLQTLFELDATPWQPAQRDMGRLADWAIVPADVPIGR